MEFKNFIEPEALSVEQVIFKSIELSILRLDKIHPIVSGNKFYKLKYNLESALTQNLEQLVTFGGAFSNHIAATAHAAKLAKIRAIGIIRGEEVNNPTLDFAKREGMQLIFVDRNTYRNKHSKTYIEKLKNDLGYFYLIPEGGTNALAVKGTAEIMQHIPSTTKTIACCVGTGGTMAGLINASSTNQKIIGFSVLKGDWINEEVRQWTPKKNWRIQTSYHFGGYAKWKPELINFINQFKQETNIPIDPIYTGKMLFGIVDLIKKGEISSEGLTIIHSGGLQGIHGFNQRYGNMLNI